MNEYKKLFSEVFGREISEIEVYEGTTLRLTGEFDGFRYRFFFNIHELVHKCKEWAYTQGYTLLPHKIEKYPKSSYLTLVESIDFAWDDLILSPNRKIKVEEFFAGTEPEAIFKACQWISEKQIEEDSKKQQQEDKEEYTEIIKEGVK